MSAKTQDFLERLLWTFLAAFLGILVPASFSDLGAWKSILASAAMAGGIAVANSVLIFARYRLSVLPNPGEGLPGEDK